MKYQYNDYDSEYIEGTRVTLAEEEIYNLFSYTDDYDGQPDEAQEWHDFDPDC